MKYLGIDYGTKRVGIAVSDDAGMISFPKVILPNDIYLVEKIDNLCQKENISAVVLGESYNMDGNPNKIMGSIEEFKRNLEAEIDLPIFFQKEFMTTIHARNLSKQTGRNGKEIYIAHKNKKLKEKKADASAASLILQRFLDKKNQN